jgi:hypothetical protein
MTCPEATASRFCDTTLDSKALARGAGSDSPSVRCRFYLEKWLRSPGTSRFAPAQLLCTKVFLIASFRGLQHDQSCYIQQHPTAIAYLGIDGKDRELAFFAHRK